MQGHRKAASLATHRNDRQLLRRLASRSRIALWSLLLVRKHVRRLEREGGSG